MTGAWENAVRIRPAATVMAVVAVMAGAGPSLPAAGQCPSAGNCCSPHGSPGCDDECCCELVCDVDPFCCDVEWDFTCVCDGALELCFACGFQCECFPGACCLPDGGCMDTHVFECQSLGGEFLFMFCDQDPCACPADTDGDGAISVSDLINVITLWGTDGTVPGIDADVDDDGIVGIADLVAVILAWGPCFPA